MVPGVVHDQSASGATLIVEPLALVELNNQLRQVEAAEAEEVRRILAQLTEEVASAEPSLASAMTTLGRLDFIIAKARLARELDATQPRLNRAGQIRLRRARHPLLAGPVVPIDLPLGDDYTTLVITGPNTGGKTVTLKTVGLLTLMAQAGLHVPAAEGSELAVFDEVLADIGDEQSIEQNLSTFSSHLTNIVRITAKVGGNCLVLLDELGAGTDPAEGAALAMAMLDHLHARGARTVATTHYSELKAFAYTRSGVENASVEFDVETLRPTYRLTIGIPGRSNAFEIATRLGLGEEIVGAARALTTREAARFEDVLRAVAENRRLTEEHRLQAEAEQVQLEKLRREYEEKVRRLELEKAQALAGARQAAEDLLREARREIDEVVTGLRQQAKERVASFDEVARQARRRVSEEGGQLAALLTGDAKEQAQATPAEETMGRGELKPGARVKLLRFNQEGVVLAPPDPAGQVLVQAGSLKVTLPAAEVVALPDAPSARRKAGGEHQSLAKAKAETIRSELDLRGLNVDEAWEMVEKYLDDAVLAGLAQVRLIHGKGTGALRQGLRDRLSAYPAVTDYRYAAPNEGGDGVTVVRLDA
jgi:DNA mismatch repair protein MutS2